MSKHPNEKQDRQPFLQFHSGVSSAGKPFVSVSWGASRAQMTPDQARDLGKIMFEVAEAAEGDAMVFAWLGELESGFSIEERAKIVAGLRHFREMARALGEADYEPISEGSSTKAELS